ncbi:myohemerythrin-like [Lingula anatina]|uniref:Myohemerythrin-like n=1 Tax=Lingula anatina TaxID=7574 RepID=A0A1S3I5S3_LINAN|nr:myohemerythrin-like [Lingula anatina]|eukprot:XP_013393602.1 myohemerythrin-like [Lingula anatina]
MPLSWIFRRHQRLKEEMKEEHEEIPKPFVWDESFRVYYDNLDEDHRKLFQGIFNCAKNPGSAQVLLDTIHVYRDHFVSEERMMKEAGFNGHDSHKSLHTKFLAEMISFQLPLDAETLEYCKDWLVHHIKSVDFNYKGKLQRKSEK